MEGSYNWFWRRANKHARGLKRLMDSNHGGRNIVGTMVACKSRQTVLRIMDIRDQSFGSSLSLSFSLPFYNTIPVHFIEENGLDVKPIYRFRSRGSKSKCEAEGDLGRTNDEMAAFPNLFRVVSISKPHSMIELASTPNNLPHQLLQSPREVRQELHNGHCKCAASPKTRILVRSPIPQPQITQG